MTGIKISGTIISGQGKGKYFLGLDWVQNQIHEKLGFRPFPGTLNIRIDDNETKKYQSYIQKKEGIKIIPPNTKFYPGKCLRSVINDQENVFIIIPETPNYPSNQIEIISSINLRKKLELLDGEKIGLLLK